MECISTKKLVRKFMELELPDDAKNLVNVMTSRGVRPAEVLMFARAFGDDVESWEIATGFMVYNGPSFDERCAMWDTFQGKEYAEWQKMHYSAICMDVDHVLEEKTLRSLCKVLKANGLIKDFGESTKELDWFVRNFGLKIPGTREVEEPKGFLDYLCRSRLRVYHMDSRRDAAVFHWMYNRFDGIPEKDIAATRTYLEVAIPEIATKKELKGRETLTTWVTAVYGGEGPDEEDYLAMKDVVAECVDGAMKHLLNSYLDIGSFLT